MRCADDLLITDMRCTGKIAKENYWLVSMRGVPKTWPLTMAKSKKQIRILHLEDDPNDSELIAIAIRRNCPECVIERISSRSDFEKALHRDFDVILSDFKIPNFSGPEALEMASKHCPEVPFIFVSGTIGEMAAVASLKLGATDYILKDAPQRLVPAIERALNDAEGRRKQKATELALAESEGRFRTLVERALVGIYLIQDARFIYANPALSQILGYSTDELRSLPLLTFIAPEDQELVKSNVDSRLSGETHAIRYDVRLRRKDGGVLQAEAHGVRTEVDGRPAIIGTLIDNTEKRKLEAQIYRAQRIESIGELSSGIAHDLNNVLSPIMMAVEMIKAKGTADADDASWLDMITTAAQRGAGMVQRILVFAKGSDGPRKPINIRDLIQDQEKIIRKSFPRSIRLVIHCSEDIRPVLGNETEIYQVLMNLCVNARDAMPKGGEIRITAENRILDQSQAKGILGATAGNYSVVSVADNGSGIPQEIIEKIFEPFFSTKGVGEGTGLGLSTAVKILKNHNGFLTVASEVGVGATFSFFLPSLSMTPV
jgi:two-component system cell cycle sensor histidine kinase/response regulator CckA